MIPYWEAAAPSASPASREFAGAVSRQHRIIITSRPAALPWPNSDLIIARSDQRQGLPVRSPPPPLPDPPASNNQLTLPHRRRSTTSIYSGLLRLSDLLARQPNISVPLFLVAPEDRREKVIQQVNRPTLRSYEPALVEVCRYISFVGLREALSAAHGYVSFLKPEWLQSVSESCALDDL